MQFRKKNIFLFYFCNKNIEKKIWLPKKKENEHDKQVTPNNNLISNENIFESCILYNFWIQCFKWYQLNKRCIQQSAEGSNDSNQTTNTLDKPLVIFCCALEL